MITQHSLSLILLLSLTATMTGCSKKEGKNNDMTTPEIIKPDQQGHTQRPHSTAKFTFVPSSAETLVDVSKPRLSNQGMSHGFTVSPLSADDQNKVQRVLEETNALRRAAGQKNLKIDPTLAAYAQRRAEEITQQYSHTRPDGTGAFSGLQIHNGASGENIYASPPTPEAAVEGWRQSPGHYKNMIGSHFDRIGIGYVYDPKSKWGYYWTQVFAGGNVSSKYHFGQNTPKETPQFVQFLANHADINQKTGALTLNGGQNVRTNASIASHNNQLHHPIYNNTKQFSHNGYRALIQDLQGSGFSYQTFGEIVDRNNTPIQYVNIGQPVIPSHDTRLQATYRGVSLGNIDQRSHFYADVTAKVDYGPRRKTMDITFDNTRFARNDIIDQHPNKNVVSFDKARNINFSEHLTWDSRKNRFSADQHQNHIHANLYGSQGEEIGGQFSRQVWLGRYEGVFGARRTER